MSGHILPKKSRILADLYDEMGISPYDDGISAFVLIELAQLALGYTFWKSNSIREFPTFGDVFEGEVPAFSSVNISHMLASRISAE
ncbi:MAG: hypothetical protein HC772_00420 [Leptolyngbyaceae cyanobacterium CRU_2_3]|nr:hypothetical protein [Leptolyngbyaceae cyanobacterium CRU_2_3]